MLASEREQLAYEESVPHVDITAELVCGWFDDSYPDDSDFCICFTEVELAALAEFNTLYDERTKRLPKSNGTIKSWLASPTWWEVMSAASKTLDRVTA